MKKSSKIVDVHKPCPKCKSSDAYCTYDDGHGYCFSCQRYFKPDGEESLEEPVNATYSFHPHRGISEKTFEFYQVYTQFVDDRPTKVGFVYPNNAVKFRTYDKKEFHSVGPMAEAGLFGTNLFDPGSKESVTIVEGEYDALAAYEITRGTSAVVSIRSASSAKRDCTRDYEWLNSFRRIVLVLDGDEPGQSASKAIASLFDFSKVYHVKLNRHKDANEYLEAGEANEFLKAWENAKRYAPDNIISTYAEFAQKLKKADKNILATYPFEGLQNALYGLHAGRVAVFKGPEGIGKTEFFRAIEHHVLKTTNHNIGILHLEEDNGDTIKALAGYELQTCTTLPDSGVSDEDVMKAIRKLTKDDETRIHIHSSWDVEDESAILDNIRFLVSAANCRIIFLDHISWLATGQDDDDERKKLDRISQRLKLLAKELDFAVVLISHVNDAGQTRGSRNITKNADHVIHLNRDITSRDENERNSISLIVEKARGGRDTGYVGDVVFDKTTYTLRDKELIESVKVPNLIS